MGKENTPYSSCDSGIKCFQVSRLKMNVSQEGIIRIQFQGMMQVFINNEFVKFWFLFIASKSNYMLTVHICKKLFV